MIIKFSIDHEDNSSIEFIGIVIAKYYSAQQLTNLAVIRPDSNYGMVIDNKQVKEIIDADCPHDWIKTKQSVDNQTHEIISFKELANNPNFLNWIIWDDYYPKESRSARKILMHEYDKNVLAYAVKKFGSIKEAKKAILTHKYKEQLKLTKERGFERPDEPDFSDAKLDAIPLDITDLVEATPLNKG